MAVLLPETPVPDLPEPAVRRAIRDRARLSRRAMGERLGCHEQLIVRWERGDGPGSRWRIPYLNLLAALDRESRQREASG